MMRALDGIRVLDFGRFIACPYCGMLLADMGAEVIRVERAGGEEDRTHGLPGENGENVVFPCYGRNKKGITLNLMGNERGKAVLADLVKHCDIVIHAFTPKAAEMMGLTYEHLKRFRSDIIVAAVTCYGQKGPYADRPGFDFMAQAMSGCMALGGFTDKPPVRGFMNPIDFGTGLAGAFSVSMALRHRDLTGEGQFVDLALLRTAISFTSSQIGEAEVLNTPRPMIGNRAAYLTATDLFPCRDGYVFIASIMSTLWKRLAVVIGHEELLKDPELNSDYQRYLHRDRIDPLLAEWTARHTVAEVQEKMEAAHIPCALYTKLEDVSSDPHVQAADMMAYMDLEEAGLEKVPVGQSPFVLSKTPARIERKPPAVGEHNEEVYRNIVGYSPQQISELKREGAI